MSRKKKQPKNQQSPKSTHIPSSKFASTENLPIRWSFSILDQSGNWSFCNCCKETFHTLITKHFKAKEQAVWSEINKGGSHSISINEMVKAAQDRLKILKMDDYEELYSLRINGQERVWGIREGQVFKVLWWDPNHEVCSSKKKHT